MFSCRYRLTSGLDGVSLVVRDVGKKVGEPRELVPAWPGIDKKRGIPCEHPFDALQNRGRVVPNFCI